MPDRSEPLSLHFHVDRELAVGRDTFHFHVSLSGTQGTGLYRTALHGTGPHDTSRHDVALSEADIYGPLSVTFCIPPNGNPQQAVRVSSSGVGSICAIGEAMFGSNTVPQKVKARVYTTDPGTPSDDPPSDATDGTMVNVGTATISPPSGCSCCNFAFHETFNNEIPNANCSSSPGIQNWLVLWAFDGTKWYASSSQPFFGVCSDGTACGQNFSAAPQFAQTPDRYQLTSSLLGPGTRVSLVRAVEECGEMEHVWKSCPISNPEAQWQLWVSVRAGRPYAVLALRSQTGKVLEVPAIWRCAHWDFNGANRLWLDCPSELLDTAGDTTVHPA